MPHIIATNVAEGDVTTPGPRVLLSRTAVPGGAPEYRLTVQPGAPAWQVVDVAAVLVDHAEYAGAEVVDGTLTVYFTVPTAPDEDGPDPEVERLRAAATARLAAVLDGGAA